MKVHVPEGISVKKHFDKNKMFTFKWLSCEVVTCNIHLPETSHTFVLILFVICRIQGRRICEKRLIIIVFRPVGNQESPLEECLSSVVWKIAKILRHGFE
jgi:hypothetical protein